MNTILYWAKHAYLQDLPLIGHALANELPVLKLWVTGLGRGVRLNLILKKAFSGFLGLGEVQIEVPLP